MKRKGFAFAILGILSLASLTGCGESGDYYRDVTSESIYGKISDFSAAKVKAGDTLQFKVTPSQYFYIDSVTNNGKKCKVVKNVGDGSKIYSTTIESGENKLKATYLVDETIDFVDKFKLNISDEVFDLVMSKQEGSDKDERTMEEKKKDLDFRRCGIEKMRAPCEYKNGKRVEKSSKDVFVNYVDGDTTHVETNNLGYTVKIRYLNIDTPESTSEIEEWGLTASYFSKYIYTGNKEYWDKIKFSFPEGYEEHLQAGITSMILVSQDANKNMENITVADLKIGSDEVGPYAATTDGNQRNLAYVWYSTAENPTKDTFRCLNLEMVYEGFSFGIGSAEATSDYVYRFFDAANLSAKANNRHLNLPEDAGLDDNYFYYKGTAATPVQSLTLQELYESAPDDSDIGKYPESAYANRKTLFKIEGYVSVKLKTAFYIQDKTEYDNDKVIAGTETPLGLYIFTYSETPIKVGDYVSCVGALSSYGGTFQMQGISYHNIPDPVRDTKVLSKGHTITPIRVTGAQFNSLKLQQVLVEITDNIWFYDFDVHSDTYGDEVISEGGSEEINKYNDAYPFYNTSNGPIFYASYGETDNAETVNTNHRGSSGRDSTRYTDEVIRFVLDQDIMVSFGAEKARSYKFFAGGESWYNPNGAEYASEAYIPENCPSDEELEALFPGDAVAQRKEKAKYVCVKRTYTRKCHMPSKNSTGHGLVCISAGYESTGGNKKMTAKIISGATSYIKLSKVDAA